MTANESANETPTFRIQAAKRPVGAKTLREGFAIDAHYDRAFALGFPYVVGIVADTSPPEEQAASASSLRLGPLMEAGTATRALRLLLGQAFRWTPKGASLTSAGKKLVEDASEIPRVQVESGLEKLVRASNPSGLSMVPFLVEAELGSDVAAQVLTRAIRQIGDGKLKRNEPDLGMLIRNLGFVLLRCSAKIDKQVRRDLGRWLESKAKLLPQKRLARVTPHEPQRSPLRAADVMLNGAEGIERSAVRPGGKLDPSSLLFCAEPGLIVDALTKSPNGNLVGPTESRHAFLGGDGALQILMKRVARLPMREAGAYVPTFGPIRHRLVTAWLERVSKLPLAAAMLARHTHPSGSPSARSAQRRG
ncbi:MAG: hypothetical protein KC731_27155 [Myxococcales bacterium]|nr:hypothetical protein [Myxococcales bacterium]